MAFLSTSGDLVARTYRFLREASAAPTKWPSAQVVDYLDEAQLHVCTDLNYFRAQWFGRTSAGVASFALPADLVTIRHVLYKTGKVTGETYVRLPQGSMGAFAKAEQGIDASGTSVAWSLEGTQDGKRLRLWPAPDTSAGSGVMVIGNTTPESIVTSASPLPRHLLPLLPLKAALLAWEDFGAVAEIQQYTALYEARMKRWRNIVVDMSPDSAEPRQWGDVDDDFPYVTLSRFGRTTGGPLNW